MDQIFQDRKQAGILLAAKLRLLRDQDWKNTIILALPRGGIPVGFEISKALGAPLEALIVRKIGHPQQPEYGVGAIAEGGFYWPDPDAVGMSKSLLSQLNPIIEQEKKEIERRVELYRNNRALTSLSGKTVLIVDDGLATGVTARVAAQYAKAKGAKKIILAVPVSSKRAANSMKSDVDKFICLNESSSFYAVGQFYRDFTQVTDEEVIALLYLSLLSQQIESQTLENSSNTVQAGSAILTGQAIQARNTIQEEVVIPNIGGIKTYGFLNVPAEPKGIVIFAHGSGSSRLSPRNQQVANELNQAGIATLLFDLLTEVESQNRTRVFDIPFLAKRLVSATRWVRQQQFGKDIPIGFFGASTGSGAALWAAAELKNEITAVVSRGGRPDLAMDRLHAVTAPTLLIVGDQDAHVIELNKKSTEYLKASKLVLIPGATHLFEESGTLSQVSETAKLWFIEYMTKRALTTAWAQRKHMPPTIEKTLEKYVRPLESNKDIAPIVDKLSQAKIVMLGESSHGTQEFYKWRRLISQELIEKHGFNFIAVEGDWPPCAEVHRFIHSQIPTTTARDALKRFQRWPTWMWANTEVARLADRMKKHNETVLPSESVGFYGLDVYSLFESMDEVITQLQKIDPSLAQRARSYYKCFDSFHRNEKSYAKSLGYLPEGCKFQVLQALEELLKIRLDGVKRERDQLFDAQQNARIVKNAEHYYRAMISGNEDSWNVRDRHMMETLNLLLKRYGADSKAIVWAHNTHIGDYRATDMAQEGQINIGGLARQQWGEDRVALLGFGTYQGEVTASHAWDGPTETMTIPPGQSQSYEALFHKVSRSLNLNSFFIWLKGELKESELSQILGHRAIGVVYHPQYEKFGNYVPTSLSKRYDGFVFVDQTEALSPFIQKFIREEMPETWPRGV